MSYHDAAGWEVLHRLRESIAHADGPIVEGARARSEDGRRDHVNHKMTEEFRAGDGRLSLGSFQDLHEDNGIRYTSRNGHWLVTYVHNLYDRIRDFGPELSEMG